MSVQNQTVKNVYAGNGSTTVFPYTFALNTDDGEYVGVYVTNDAGTSETTDNFTIDTTAKTVTYPTVGDPLESGKKITIKRELPNEQNLNLENLGPFFADDIESEMDREVMMIQQLAEEVERAVKVDMASDHTPEEFLQDIADAVQAAKDYADEAQDSADDADASVTKAADWAEGSDADVAALGGTHSSKGWSDVAKGHSDDASGYATAASGSATAASGSETNASYWAEGTDGQVAPLGGTHSAKGWAADSAASAASVVANVGKAATWAEGSDADVAVLGGEHSSKGWSDEAKAWAMSMANLPVASIIPWGGSSNTPPVGFLFCDGSAVSRTMYPDLFAAIGITWGAGDGSTTFNLPTSEDLVLQGASTTNPVGTYLQAGLPNIEGSFGSVSSSYRFGNGAFAADTSGNEKYTVTGGAGTNCGISFDASRSNSIYGNSNTVQPPAACVRFMIKAFDGQTPDSALIDITQYASDLANKADRSLSNLNQTGEDHFLERDCTIIYPNGGSESSPASISNNSRYVEANPFPGYAVRAVTEVYINGSWGSFENMAIYGTQGGTGIMTNTLDDNIVIQTGSVAVVGATSSYNGDPFNNYNNVYSAPARVKVWKIGKLVNNA